VAPQTFVKKVPVTSFGLAGRLVDQEEVDVKPRLGGRATAFASGQSCTGEKPQTMGKIRGRAAVQQKEPAERQCKPLPECSRFRIRVTKLFPVSSCRLAGRRSACGPQVIVDATQGEN